MRSFAHSAIEGQRGGFRLLLTRARACGDLPSVRQTSSARPEEKVEGLGGVHFFILLLLLLHDSNFHLLLQAATTKSYLTKSY